MRLPTKTHLCTEGAAPGQEGQEPEQRPGPLTSFFSNINSFEPPTHPMSLFPSPRLHLLLLLETCSSTRLPPTCFWWPRKGLSFRTSQSKSPISFATLMIPEVTLGPNQSPFQACPYQNPSLDLCITEQARDGILSSIGTMKSMCGTVGHSCSVEEAHVQ